MEMPKSRKLKRAMVRVYKKLCKIKKSELVKNTNHFF